MIQDDEPTLITNPTEVERGDALIVLTFGMMGLFVCWWLLQRGVHPLVVLVPAVVCLTWMLTSRSATEVPYVGGFAVGIRSKLGERDVHVWLLAVWHFWRLAVYPVWGSACGQFLKSSRRRVFSLRRR